MKPLFRIAFKNSLKNWRRSLAAIISVSAGFLSLVIFQGYMIEVDRMYLASFTHRAMYGHLLIENPDLHTTEGHSEPEKFFLSKDQQTAIENFFSKNKNQIVARVRFLPLSGMIANGKNSFIFLAMGYDVQEGAVVRGPEWEWDALYGVPLQKAVDEAGIQLGQELGFLVGCLPVNKQKNLVHYNGIQPGDRPFTCENDMVQLTTTTDSGQLNALDLKIVSLIDGGYRDIDQRWIKMPLPVAQTLLNTDKIRFTSVLLKDDEDVIDFRDRFNDEFKSMGMNIKASKWIDHPVGALYRQTQSLLGVFQAFIVIIILTIAGLSVLNTMIKNVKERTREIGTLRSIGFSGNQVKFIFSLEAVYLALMGVVVGILTTLCLTVAVNAAGIRYRAGFLSEPIEFRISVDGGAYFLCLCLLLGLSVITGYLACRATVGSTVAENLAHV
jgi:putative ABC transport system permease protein